MALFLIAASLVGSFYVMRWIDRWMNSQPSSLQLPKPKPQPNEDDPDFMAWIERKVRRRKD